MGVTLHGERAVGFVVPEKVKSAPMEAKWPPDEVTLPMRKGDVYVSTPAAIMHGVSTRQMAESERSVALQCRNLFDAPSAQFWNKYKQPLNGLVAQLLAEHSLTMPSLEEVRAAEAEVLAQWRSKLPDPPATIVLSTLSDE